MMIVGSLLELFFHELVAVITCSLLLSVKKQQVSESSVAEPPVERSYCGGEGLTGDIPTHGFCSPAPFSRWNMPSHCNCGVVVGDFALLDSVPRIPDKFGAAWRCAWLCRK